MEIMTKSLGGVWPGVLALLKKQLSAQSYDTWFAPTKQVGTGENKITVEVPNKFFKDWLIEHYKEHVSRAIASLDTERCEVEFVVGERVVKKEAPPAREQEKRGFGFFTKPFERFAQPQAVAFNQKYTFDSFVIGGCNRFAHAASMAVAETPAKAYNPLFIYGGVGLGKTHLMQAVGQHTTKKHPRLKVLYISCERFTNQLIGAIQNRTTPAFREQYRHQDVLLIDDIQFLSGKESTQEEFFHTFNALYDSYKQIVISSDRPPKEIPALEKRLVSRFEWGLVTDIQAPDLETRVAILRKKLTYETAVVPDDVLFFIAEKIKTNIRELEGALVRVIAYSSLVGDKIGLGVAKEVLKEVDDEKARVVSIERIQQVVAEYFSVGGNELRGKKRTKRVAYPRQVAMYLARELTKMSLVEVGGFFGGRDHTTVMHACEKIEGDVKKDPHLKSAVSTIVTQIKAG